MKEKGVKEGTGRTVRGTVDGKPHPVDEITAAGQGRPDLRRHPARGRKDTPADKVQTVGVKAGVHRLVLRPQRRGVLGTGRLQKTDLLLAQVRQPPAADAAHQTRGTGTVTRIGQVVHTLHVMKARERAHDLTVHRRIPVAQHLPEGGDTTPVGLPVLTAKTPAEMTAAITPQTPLHEGNVQCMKSLSHIYHFYLLTSS